MATTTYFDATFGVRAIGLRTDNAGGDVTPDLTGEEDRFESADIGAGYATPATSFEVTAATVWNVDVGSGATDVDVYAVAGTAEGQGTYIVRMDQAQDTLTIAAADASDPRKDEIYLVVVDNDYDSGGKSLPRLAVRGGVAASSPSVPGPDAAWDAYALLATIDIPALAADITACTITDERAMSQLIVDAPTLEGNDSTDFSVAGHDHDSTYADLAHVATTDEHPDVTPSASGFMAPADKIKLDGIETGADVNPSAASLLTDLKTVDGAGSLLDADKLDGQHGSYYATDSHGHTSRYYTEGEQNSNMDEKANDTERVRVTKTGSAQSVASSTMTDITLNSEVVDDWNGHTGSNAGIDDDGAGYYLVLGAMQLAASTAGFVRQIEIFHSSSGTVAFDRTNTFATDATWMQVMTVVYMDGTQNVRLRAWHDAGTSLDLAINETWLEVVKLG
jgi:hypothetical protein